MPRAIIKVSGPDAVRFLQGLVTNDLRKLPETGLLYAAMLSPQGKYLSDFFLLEAEDGIFIDVAETLGDDLLKRLALYKLRSAVVIERADLPVSRGTSPAPEGALPDPRHPALGWRLYGADLPDDGTDWDAVRVAHCIPETGLELVPNDTYILEAGFGQLNGADFRKGCYVGQEVTARMQHKTELRKGFATVELDAPVAFGTDILAGDVKVGQIFTSAGNRAIAYLRFDRARGQLSAGGIGVVWKDASEAA